MLKIDLKKILICYPYIRCWIIISLFRLCNAEFIDFLLRYFLFDILFKMQKDIAFILWDFGKIAIYVLITIFRVVIKIDIVSTCDINHCIKDWGSWLFDRYRIRILKKKLRTVSCLRIAKLRYLECYVIVRSGSVSTPPGSATIVVEDMNSKSYAGNQIKW